MFIPIAFLPGTAGGLFREFGFVLACAVVISSFVALSLIPSAMAHTPGLDGGEPGALGRAAARLGHATTRAYDRALGTVLDQPWPSLLIALLIAGGIGGLYTALERELLPSEDRGTLNVYASGPDGVGLNYSERQADRLEAVLAPLVERGEIEMLYTVIGRWDPNRTFVVAPLADWSVRERSQQAIQADIQRLLNNLPGARAGSWGSNSLNLRGSWGGDLQLALIGSNYDDIFVAARDRRGDRGPARERVAPPRELSTDATATRDSRRSTPRR